MKHIQCFSTPFELSFNGETPVGSHCDTQIIKYSPGAVARSEACPLGMQAAPSSIPTSGTFFRRDLVMKKKSTAILSLPLIQEEQLSVTGERMCTKYW